MLSSREVQQLMNETLCLYHMYPFAFPCEEFDYSAQTFRPAQVSWYSSWRPPSQPRLKLIKYELMKAQETSKQTKLMLLFLFVE